MAETTNLPAIMAAYWMHRQLSGFLAEHKADLLHELGPGDSVSARYDLDGQELPLGKATRTEPKPAWKLVAPDALLDWAKEHMPELVIQVDALEPEGLKALMAQVKHQNGAFTEEGEVIPGIVWDNTGTSHVRFTPAKDIQSTLSLLAREGRLAALTDGLLGITDDPA